MFQKYNFFRNRQVPQQLVERAEHSDIWFAQTREDPNVEMKALESILKEKSLHHDISKTNVVVIGSGGETSCCIWKKFSHLNICVIDQSEAQLHLCALKLALSHFFQKDTKLMEYLLFRGTKLFTLEQLEDIFCDTIYKEHVGRNVSSNVTCNVASSTSNIGELSEVLLEICCRNQHLVSILMQLLLTILYLKSFIQERTWQFWLQPNHLNMLIEGVNWCGRYEALFEMWHKYQCETKDLFSHSVLCDVFGKNAVQQSDDFPSHFETILKAYRREKQFTKKQNYFFNIFQAQEYSTSRPFYLRPTQTLSFQTNRENLITYIHSTIYDFLQASGPQTLDLISLSNITDWCDAKKRHQLYQLIQKVLKAKGMAVFRKFNGSYNLQQELRQYFRCCKLVTDSSHFYRQVVLVSNFSFKKM